MKKKVFRRLEVEKESKVITLCSEKEIETRITKNNHEHFSKERHIMHATLRCMITQMMTIEEKIFSIESR